jgi:A/G-specific adenine glycosylase
MKKQFTRLLMQWHVQENKRTMPWKEEKDPYKIWLSEIILQQTRVEQGWSYYERFISNYPTVEKLAKAKDEDVFKLWEGLGYYNRCKNLLFTAREIVKKYKANFPEKFEEIIELKGVGPYTAAAIASFAFNLPHAVVDGNVFRVLSRVFGVETAIDSTKGKHEFTELANEVLDKKQAGKYNQAIMDFGATVCKPVKPLCNHCVLQKICTAYKTGKVNYLPVKEKTLQRKNRWLYYFLFEVEGKILINKRTGNDIWQSLFEFYLLESTEQIKWNETEVKDWLLEQFAVTKASIIHISEIITQQLTHQQIKGQFIKIELPLIPDSLKGYEWMKTKELKKLAFSKFINQYLEKDYLQASLF